MAVLVGAWRHAAPWDSDDYLTEYTISIRDGLPSVTALDLSDGEVFIISDVQWDGSTIRFHSFMPSTGREGLNEFSLGPGGVLQSRFTFSVVETLQRVAI